MPGGDRALDGVMEVKVLGSNPLTVLQMSKDILNISKDIHTAGASEFNIKLNNRRTNRQGKEKSTC